MGSAVLPEARAASVWSASRVPRAVVPQRSEAKETNASARTPRAQAQRLFSLVPSPPWAMATPLARGG